MATLNDAYRKIFSRVQELGMEFAGGTWMDDEKSPEWHGAQAMRRQAHIAGMREALQIITEIQRDN
jgi:hypothetical protein